MQQFVTSHCGDLTRDVPYRVGAVQGQSRGQIDLAPQNRIPVAAVDTDEVWHSTDEQGFAGIMRSGIIPGGVDRVGGRIGSF